MNHIELLQQYRNYLDDIAELHPKAISFTRGVLHGLGIALGIDYDAVERDIRQARQPGILSGQIQLAI